MTIVALPLLLLFGSMRVDFAPFVERSGCTHMFDIYYNCTAGPAFDLGCAQLRNVRLLGGFGVPVAECHGSGLVDASGNAAFIRKEGVGYGVEGYYVRLLVATPDGFEVVRDLDELRQRFAPVESEEEALSFAIAASGASLFDKSWKTPPGYRRVAERARPTDVVRRADGSFVVRNLLFDASSSCLQGPYMLADIAVTRDGIVVGAAQGTTLATIP
ncbi:MAG TPA: hypothetical protein VJZ00_20125 [Thermoanaerobaculia bacterium]|nr:hypothetical protein [Thermoanaerobaculia bacterium]